MKKFLVLALAAVCFAGVNAQSAKKEAFSHMPDTVPPLVSGDAFSYAMGVLQSKDLKQYLIQREGIDEAYMGEAIKGMTKKLSEKKKKKALAFAAGLRIAEMNEKQILPALNKQATGVADTTYIVMKTFNAGLTEGIQDKAKITADSAQKVVEQQMEAFAAQVKNLNLSWLANNASAPGVKVLPAGLQYRVVKEGTGAQPPGKSKEEEHYEGKLIDGTVFDSSYKRGKTATFPVFGVIKGWTEALQLMTEGSEWELFIPYQLAYGERGQGNDIPPYATLIFKVELIKVQ